MPDPPLLLRSESFERIDHLINKTVEFGGEIRQELAKHSTGKDHSVEWEVQAAVEALNVFGSRWTIEILSTLYIAKTMRFNEMKVLLSGISSRTLSDKLQFLMSEDLVERIVDDGPPIRVHYQLSDHGINCGRLLSPLVAHLKIRQGSVMNAEQ
jgi:DNA-binding HxlR family transcriptional regulator